MAALMLPAGASASAVDEYTEFVPTGGGKTPSKEVGSSPPGSPLSSPSGAGAAPSSGPAASPGPATAGTGNGEQGSGDAPDRNDSGPQAGEESGGSNEADDDGSLASDIPAVPFNSAATLEGAYDSDGGGVGIVLPLLLGLSLLAAGGLLVAQRRSKPSSTK